MTERFEFEVDTTKANEYWRAEVAENLAKKAAEDEASEKVPTAGGGV
jgi:3-ketosteroid 9alpha-monooxygenase subunit A